MRTAPFSVLSVMMTAWGRLLLFAGKAVGVKV